MSKAPSPVCLAALVLLLVTGLPATAARAQSGDSETGAFASIDVGARALGMGGAGTVAERSAWATHWNPANLFYLEQKELAIDHVDLFGLDLVHHTRVAYAWRTRPTRNVIRDGRLLEVPRQEDRVGLGFSLGVTSVDLDPQSYTEVTPSFSIAGRPWGSIALGGTLKLLAASSDLDNTSAFGVAIDLGLGLDGPAQLSAGLAVKNLMSTVSWSDDTTDTLPTAVTGGVRYAGLASTVLALEATISSDTPFRDFRLGGEWAAPRGRLLIRGGAIVHEDRGEDRADLTFGAGTGARGVHADYAFVGQNDTLGDTHRISLSLRF